MAGIEDCYTASVGSTCTLGNFAKATYQAIQKTYAILTPDLWPCETLEKPLYSQHSEFLLNLVTAKTY